MRRSVLLAVGLVAVLAAQEARAACLEGATQSCTSSQGCPGESECVNGRWTTCEFSGEPKSCSRTNACGTYSGTQACDSNGSTVGSCNVAEVCNGCDENLNGQVDEGLAGCTGVVCGSMFERCGDGLDNDCDGLIDEGCNLCTGTMDEFPFVFNSQNELKKATNALANYADRLSAKWKFIPSHRMTDFGFVFSHFHLEENYDFFHVTPSLTTATDSLTGELTLLLPYYSNLYPLTQGTMPTLRFASDNSIETSTGVQISQVQAKCDSGGGLKYYSMSINEGADGVLLYTGDNAYFTFSLPANREVFINMDHDFGSIVNFDMFVTTSGTKFGTSSANSDAFANTTNSTGEVVHLDPVSFARQVRVNVVSKAGAGRFRIFLASPVVQDAQSIELAFVDDIAIGSALDLRMKQEWAETQRHMMNSTDGQFRIRPDAYIGRDVWCEVCYDVVFRETNNASLPLTCSGGCTPACSVDNITVAGPYWSSSAQYTSGDGTKTCNAGSVDSVARTLVHEWGHYDFGMWHEERADDASGVSRNQCGWSIMAGSAKARDLNHFEWCDEDHHLTDREIGAPVGGYDDNWAYITDEYPEMSVPAGTGDFSQMKRLGELMRAQSFVTFTEK